MFSLMLAPASFDLKAIFGNFTKRWYYYLALFIALILIAVYSLTIRKKRANLDKTRKLVYTAIFSALAFIANYFTIKVSDALQLSLVATVGFFAGYTLGGGLGFVASFMGDLICGIVAPLGAYSPIIGLGSGLWGFVPGVLFTAFDKKQYVISVISFTLCFFLNSFIVNTLGLTLMYGMSFESLLLLLPYKLIGVVVNAIVCILLMPVIDRILPKDKFPFAKG